MYYSLDALLHFFTLDTYPSFSNLEIIYFKLVILAFFNKHLREPYWIFIFSY